MTLFAVGALTRGCLAAGFAAFTTLGCWVIDGRARPPATADVTPPLDLGEVRLRFECTYTVRRWQVSYAGSELVPEHADDHRWTGKARLRDDEPCLMIEAEGDDPFADRPVAIRAVLDRDGHRAISTLWGTGTVSGLLTLDEEAP